MAVDFSKSKTRENLMRAFAGESQARNRYTIAAKQASRDNLYSISQIFLFTADQERAHAEVFYELLRGQTEQTIEICGGYPVNLAENVTDLLKSAVHNEMQEFEDVYPEFAKIAKEEGFDQAAGAFDMIAKVEAVHGRRFALLAELLGKNQYFENPDGGEWMCMNCGHIQKGRGPDVGVRNRGAERTLPSGKRSFNWKSHGTAEGRRVRHGGRR